MKESTKRRIEELGLNLSDFEPNKQTDSERIKELEEHNEMLTECILELSTLLYE